MASITRCDQCGKDARNPVDWYHLQPLGATSSHFITIREGRDFCSLECVALWAADKSHTQWQTVAADGTPLIKV